MRCGRGGWCVVGEEWCVVGEEWCVVGEECGCGRGGVVW